MRPGACQEPLLAETCICQNMHLPKCFNQVSTAMCLERHHLSDRCRHLSFRPRVQAPGMVLDNALAVVQIHPAVEARSAAIPVARWPDALGMSASWSGQPHALDLAVAIRDFR